MTKRLLTVGFAVIVVVLLALVVVHKKQQLAHLPLPPNPPTPVRTAAVRDGQASNSVETVALIQSETAATVAAQVPGAILEMRWREGDRVAKGQVMALIDPRTLEDAVQAAQARLAAADEDYGKQKAIFARDKALLDGGAIAPQAFDISKAQLAGADAARVGAEKALQSAKVVRSYASTSAPYAGVVTARLAEPGDLAFPGKPLYTIQVPGPVKLLSKLAQDQLAQLRVGDQVTFGSGATAVVGTTSRIYPALDAAHLGSVETVLPQVAVRPASGRHRERPLRRRARPGARRAQRGAAAGHRHDAGGEGRERHGPAGPGDGPPPRRRWRGRSRRRPAI